MFDCKVNCESGVVRITSVPKQQEEVVEILHAFIRVKPKGGWKALHLQGAPLGPIKKNFELRFGDSLDDHFVDQYSDGRPLDRRGDICGPVKTDQLA